MTSRSSRDGGRRQPRAKKRFAQHFLSDSNILNRIVDAAALSPGDTVIEVGPGLGTLTAVLAKRAGRVVAVEVDRDLVAVLVERFAGTPNVAVVAADVLDLTPREMLARGGAAPPYVVVANLPYNIAAPVLRRFLEADVQPLWLVVMVQLEVAEAIVARPPRMTLIGLATQVYGEASMIMRVAPGSFNPPPRVQSAVVRIDVLPAPRVDVPLDVFFRVVRAGFGNPRKQLRNSLSFGLHVEQARVDEVMRAAGIAPALRPQTLGLDDWAALARAWLERAHA